MSRELQLAITSSIFAGCGGLLPSLSNMAGKMINQPTPDPPHMLILIPLGIFFFIGVILNCAFNRTDWEIGKALVIGISAPGIITNLVNGANINNSQNIPTSPPALTQPSNQRGNLFWPFLGTAYAQTPTLPTNDLSNEVSNPPQTASTPLLLNITLGGPYAAGISGLPVTTVIFANTPNRISQEIFRTDVAPVKSMIQIPKGTVSITFTILSKNGNTFSSGASVPLPANYFTAKIAEKPASVEIVLHATTSSDTDVWWAFGSDRPPTINSVDATINGVPYLSAPRPAVCRRAENGIERFQNTFIVEQKSGWRGGGYNQNAWCSDVIGSVKASYPPSSEFKIIGSSEQSKKQFLGRVEYNYVCQIQINTNPLFVEAPNEMCGSQ